MNNLKVTAELLDQVSEVLQQAAKNRYSVSKVYGAYAAVTGKKETPQTCATCLRNRVKALREWYDKANVKVQDLGQVAAEVLSSDPVGKPEPDTTPPQDEERPDGLAAGPDAETPVGDKGGATIDVIRLHVEVLPLPVYFQPGDKDPHKGKAYLEGGGSIKPGKYETSDDRELAVQPGGKATLKAAPVDNDLL